jgi:hypothetical protein
VVGHLLELGSVDGEEVLEGLDLGQEVLGDIGERTWKSAGGWDGGEDGRTPAVLGVFGANSDHGGCEGMVEVEVEYVEYVEKRATRREEEEEKRKKRREERRIRSQQETTWGCFDDFTGAGAF